jgi:hypothetical protein
MASAQRCLVDCHLLENSNDNPSIRMAGFPPFKASQFQNLFKTFSRLNYLEIKTQLIRFRQILMKHQVTGKPTKEFGMMCLRLLNDYSGTFFNKMAIFKTFSRLYQRNHRILNLFKALEFFFRIPKLFHIFPHRGNPGMGAHSGPKTDN